MLMAKTWSKKEIAQIVSKNTDVELLSVEKIASATYTTIREVMAETDPECCIEIRNFGTFEV